MTYLLLVYEFFKIGFFSFGGGYATIPFLYHVAETYGWYTINELSHMIAVAAITPGPVGINVATYAGLKTGGILGSLIATTSEILPSFILVIIVSKLLKKFSDNFYIRAIIASLKPVSCALLISVMAGLVKHVIGDIKAIILLFLLLIISTKSKKDPIFYISISAIVGMMLRFCNIL